MKNLSVILTTIAIGMEILITSCNNTSIYGDYPKQTAFKQPVTVPLTFSKATMINWAVIKNIKVKLVVKKIDMDKLPAEPYVSNGLKSAPYDMDEVKFDYGSLPQKNLDIDQLPSKPLKFKTINLPPPKVIKSGPPRLKNTSLSLYELRDAEGLPDGIISCVFNDRNGFLWIGTTKGIYRYDGENLLLYISASYKDADYYHYALDMLQDRQGRIWISIQHEGVEILDPIKGTLKKTNTFLGLGSNNPFRMLLDKQQRVWVSDYSPTGVNIIDPKTETVKWLNKEHGLSDTSQVTGLIADKDSNIWVSSWKGINVIDLKNKKIKYITHSSGLKSDSVDQALFDSKGNLYIALRGGIIDVLNITKGNLQSIKNAWHPGTEMYSLIQDNRGRIWVATTKTGVEIIDPERREISNLSTTDGLASGYVIDLNQDSRGQIWAATQNGVNMIGSKQAIVEHIGDIPTTAVAEDGYGLIWQCSLYHGVNIIDRKSKVIRRFDKNNGLGNDTMNFVKAINGRVFIGNSGGLDIIDSNRKILTHLGKKEGFSNTTLGGVAIDKAGKIWLGGNNGMDVYDPRSNTCKHLGNKEGLKDTYVSDMNIDLQGKIWISNYPGGITEIDPETGIIRTITNAPFTSKDQRTLQSDHKGNMWFGTLQGLYFADMKSQKLTSFSSEQGLPDKGVLAVQSYKNRIYAGTGKGISVITPPDTAIYGDKSWGIQSFNNLYGLDKIEPGFETDALTRDGLYLWGDKGITVFNLDKKDRYISPAYITTISIMDQPKFFTGRGHTTLNGLTWNKATAPFNMPDNLHLPYNQNYLRFNYCSLNVADHDTILYSYQLVGVDKTWSSEGTANVSRNYFNMSPGEYTFKVITKSSDAGWSKPALLTFTINPPWWKTWWAYILYFVLLGGSIWGFSNYMSRKLIKDKRVLEHKVHIRTEEVQHQKEEIEAQRDELGKAFDELKITQTQLIQSEKMASLGELTAGIAHEIQNPLNFVNNFSEVNTELIGEMKQEIQKGDLEEIKAIALDIEENSKKINMHGKRADSIVKSMLEHSRSNTGEKQLTDLNVLCNEFLKLSFHGFRAKDKSFNAEMLTHFDPDLPEVNISQQDMGRVMLNLFNNAFYAVNQKAKIMGGAYKAEVFVTTLQEKGSLIIRVKDNGSGIPDTIKDKIMQPFFTTKPTGEGTGLGLSLSYDIVVKGHGGKIEGNTKEGEFTEFTITLPV